MSIANRTSANIDPNHMSKQINHVKNTIKNTTNTIKNATKNTYNQIVVSSKKNRKLFIIVLLIIGILLCVGLYKFFNNYITTTTTNFYLLHGAMNSKQPTITVKGNKIKRSDDSNYGMEFTYAFWLYVIEWPKTDVAIFHKGSQYAYPLIAPGVFLNGQSNTLTIYMNTYNKVLESCEVTNIPIEKWVHITLQLIENNMDVYINGSINLKSRINI